MATISFDQFLKMGGINPQNPDEISQVKSLGINSILSQPSEVKKKITVADKIKSFTGDIKQDVVQTGKDIISGSMERADKITDIKQKLKTGEKKDIPAILETAGQLAGAGADAIGSVFKGAVKAVLPPKAEEKVKEIVNKFGEEVAQRPEVQGIVKWYSGLPQEKQDALDATGGVISLASEFVGLGAAKKGVTLTKEAVQTGLDTTKQIAETTGKKVIETTGKIVEKKTPKLLSIFTGEKDDVVRSALDNPDIADLGIKNGDEALRKAVQTGADSSIKAKQSFVKAHSNAFKQLVKDNPNKLVSRQKILYQFVDDLEKSGAKVKNGKIDFSTSKIVANPGEIAKIKTAYEAIKKWKDFSLAGTNELKQLLGQLTKFANEAGGSSKSPFLGKYYNYIDNEIKGNLPETSKKAYVEMNKKFSDSVGLYDDMVDAFNSGDPFTKLAQIFGNNKDTLRQIVDFYEKTTGNKIAPIVAGRTLAESKPAAFGFLNPRQWIDFFIDPKTQASLVTKVGKKLKK